MRLIIRDINVKHFDSSTDKTPSGQGSFTTKIRTEWYSVNHVALCKRLVSADMESGEISSDLRRLAPEAGLEPATRRLTAGCSTIELLWSKPLRQQGGAIYKSQFSTSTVLPEFQVLPS